MNVLEDVLEEFKARINNTYKGDILYLGDEISESRLGIKRFSSGIFSLDMALGGGWPFSRIIIISGEESTGKSLKMIKACASVQEYDRKTHRHKDFCEEGKFEACRSLFLDVEGTWDEEWAKKLGFDNKKHMIAQPEYAEQGIDIVNTAIRENIFDLIVVDSIAAMIPSTELEESSEDFQVGLQARLVNKAMRKWVSSLIKVRQTAKNGGATILCSNQFRLKIGSGIYGDPRVLPAGRGQLFAASIICYTRTAKVEDGADKETEYVTLGGNCKKNKTYIPKKNYEFTVRLRDGEELAGYVDNIGALVDEGKRLGLIKKAKGEVSFGKTIVSSEVDFKARLKVSEVLRKQLWRSAVKAECNCVV